MFQQAAECLPDGEFRLVGVMGIICGGPGEAREGHQQCPQQDNRADDQVRGLNRLGLAHEIGRVELFDARQDKGLSDPQAYQRAERIEGLRQVEPEGGVFFIAQYGHQRIGRGFQKSQPGGDDKQGREEPVILADFRRRIKQEGAEREKTQAGDDHGLVTKLAHEKTGRQGQQEIAHIEGGLHQTGLEIG